MLNERLMHREVLHLSLFFGLLGLMSCMIGAIGVINALRGEYVTAASALLLPAGVVYLKWDSRADPAGREPFFRYFVWAWVAGLPLGLLAHFVRQWLLPF